jgi:hypothetical protein
MTVASSTNDARKPQWLTTPRTFLAVVFLGIVVISARDVTDPDVWWHLKTGQLIAQTRAIPHVDSFSFTRAGSPWIAHEWLTELLIYGVYQVGGWGALIVVFAVIVSAAFFLLYLRSAPNPYGSGLIVLLGAWATAPLWGVRPQMISLLLTSLWLLILERSERDRRLLWWTLPITVLWVNLHAGFALGIALVMLFLVGEFVEQFIFSGQSNSARLRTLAVTLLLDLLLIPLNPNGWKMYLYPLDTLRSKAIQTYIAEWASPNFHRAVYLPFLLLLPGITACWASSRVRVRPRDILLLLASTFAALHSIRMIPFFVLIAVPILSRSLEHWTRFSRACSDRSHASRSGSASSWLVPAGHAAWLNALILLAVAGFVGFKSGKSLTANFASRLSISLQVPSPTFKPIPPPVPCSIFTIGAAT